MTHAFSLIPNFSVPLAVAERESLPFHADPVLAAIDAHNEAWSAFQIALPGQTAEQADEDLTDALAALLGTACATRPGAFCLLRHLRWLLAEEAGNAETYGELWRVVQAREADLTLLLGCDGIDRIPPALPSGRLLALPAPPTRIEHCRRFLAIGEAIGALVLVAGGCLVTGLATLV